MRPLPTLRLLLFMLGLLIVLPFSNERVPSALAQNNSGITMSVAAGFDSYYKAHHWFPLQIEVSNVGPSVEGEIRYVVGDALFDDEVVYATPISLPTQSNKRVTLLVNSTGASQTGDVELVNGNGQLIHAESVGTLRQLPSDTMLYGVVSSEGGELAYLEDIYSGSFVGAEVAFLSLEQLPETAVAWHNLDIIILNDVDTTQLTSNQLAALNYWVAGGGQLIVTGGNGWEKTVTAVDELLPVSPTGSETVPDLPGLNQQISIPFRDAGPYLITTSILRRGELLFFDDDLPILAVNRVGRGGVYFLAIDPRSAPLLDWDGTEQLWRAVAARVPINATWHAPFQNNSSAYFAARTLPDLNLPSAWTFFFFLLGYVVLVGPANYLVLRRRNQLDKAWFTIPALILLFSMGTYFVGSRIRGSTALVNQLSVAISQSDSEAAEVQTLLGIYAPQRGNYQLTVPGDVLIRPLRNTYDNFTTNFTKIQESSDNTVQGMRLDVGEVASFVTHGYRPAIRVDGRATLQSENGSTQFVATLQNNSDDTLTDVTLLFGTQIFTVGDMAPGSSETIHHSVNDRSLVSRGISEPHLTTAGSSPLMSNLTAVLGGSDYYTDPDLIRRRELIEAIENNGTNFTIPTNSVTLIFWTDTPQLDVTLNRDIDVSNTTLHFVELPLTINLALSEDNIIPTSLLDWTVIESNNVFSPEPTNVSFSQNASVAFEYTPLADYQTMDIRTLAVSVGESGNAEPFPLLYLWNWERDVWVPIENATWGDTAVASPEPFIGPNNSVRIRLIDQSTFGVFIDNVYPILSGTIEE